MSFVAETLLGILLASTSLAVTSAAQAQEAFAAEAPPVTCARSALPAGFSISQAVRLCGGATSNAPVDCAKALLPFTASKDVITDVCAGANSVAPANCFRDFVRWMSDGHLATSLCTTRQPFQAPQQAIALDAREDG